jgi:hypothetical protein
MLARLLAAVLAAGMPAAVAAADPQCSTSGDLVVDGLGVPADDLSRVAEISGAVAPSPRLIRRGGVRREAVCAEAVAPWLDQSHIVESQAEGAPASVELLRLPLRLENVWNSTYPSGRNDGLLWAGRGVAQQLSGGIAARYGAISASIAPAVAWSENRAFELVPNGRSGDLAFGNPYYGNDNIDLPQRFGVGPSATWAPGQSYLRADLWNVALGISTENLWLGSGIRNSILMSNAGPGFPHVFIGTSRPADIWIGKAEVLLFWGRLERTRFISGGGHPLITGLAVTYVPRWVPGLSVGVGRTHLQPWDGLRFRDYFAMFQSFEKKQLQSWYGPTGDNARDNQLAAAFARWVFPEVGLEIFGEWAREDHDWTWWGTVREPDHSQAYLLGLQKTFRAGARLVRLHAELAHLQELRPLANVRGVPVYYVHNNDLGYTNGGQLLGAWIGPGADSQTIAVDVFHRGGRIGGYLERVRRNDAYYWAVVEPVQGSWSHDAELTLGVRQVLRVGPAEVSWDLGAAFRQNRDFIRHERNLKAELGLAVPFGR